MDRARRKDRTDIIAELEAELAIPPFPTALAYLWKAYHRLRRRIGGGFSGPNPIGWQDLDSFVRQTQFALAPWEIEILERVDDAYIAPIARQAAAQREQPSTTMVSASDATGVRRLMRSFGKPKTATKKGG